MPQLQVIDTTPTPRAPTTLENILSSAAQEYNKVANARRESDALGAIYKRYQEEGQTLEKTIMDIQKDPLLSPTTRVNSANQLLQFQKTNNALQKEALNEQRQVLNLENKKLEQERKTKKETLEREEKEQKIIKDQNTVEALYLENGYEPEEAKNLAKFDTPAVAQAKIKERNIDRRIKEKNDLKKQQEKEKDEMANDRAQKAFNRLVELIPKVGRSNVGYSYLGGESSESFGEFSSSLGLLENALADLVSRGKMTDTRFRYITQQLLPTPSDTQATIRGKLRGLARDLGLDPKVLGPAIGAEKEKKDRHEGMVQVRDPQGVLRWVPKEVAEQLGATK